MTIAINGAAGQSGGHTIDALLARGVDPADILALGRDVGRLGGLAALGIRTATIDLADEAATAATLTGVDKLLLISVGGPGEGLAPRTAAINAAATAGVPHIVYTSALNAPTTTFLLAAEHKATEDVITASGIPATRVNGNRSAGERCANGASGSPARARIGNPSSDRGQEQVQRVERTQE
jgi:NAD(P)H dehydrogenase (quinone)